MTGQSTLEVFKDGEGSVALGWVDEGVLYSRLSVGLSAEVGNEFAKRLLVLSSQVSSLSYFSDYSALSHYDLLARSSFVRTVLASRRKFTALVFLTWPENLSPATKNLVSVLGEPIELLTDGEEFEARLLRAAPQAKQKLDPRTWVHAAKALSVRR